MNEGKKGQRPSEGDDEGDFPEMCWREMLSVVDLKDKDVVDACFAPAIDVESKQENEKCLK